jgi:hypothetical protein
MVAWSDSTLCADDVCGISMTDAKRTAAVRLVMLLMKNKISIGFWAF